MKGATVEGTAGSPVLAKKPRPPSWKSPIVTAKAASACWRVPWKVSVSRLAESWTRRKPCASMKARTAATAAGEGPKRSASCCWLRKWRYWGDCGFCTSAKNASKPAWLVRVSPSVSVIGWPAAAGWRASACACASAASVCPGSRTLLPDGAGVVAGEAVGLGVGLGDALAAAVAPGPGVGLGVALAVAAAGVGEGVAAAAPGPAPASEAERSAAGRRASAASDQRGVRRRDNHDMRELSELLY